MRRLLVPLVAALACAGALAQPRAATEAASTGSGPAGRIELAEGERSVLDRAQKTRKVSVGDVVYEGESLVTGRDGELHLNMEDGGFIAVRPNTRMQIVAYRAQGQSDDRGVFRLLQGAFRSVTGWIGKYNPASYQVRTPTATIGVRGTDHEPLVIPQGSSEGEAGTYDKVNAGGTFIQTRHGRVEVAPNQAAFAGWRGKPVPRLLREIPAAYRPTRNEPLLAARHEAVQKVLEQRRDARRKVFEERRSLLERQQVERKRARDELKMRREKDRFQQREERGRQWQERRERAQSERRLRGRDGGAGQAARVDERRERGQPEGSRPHRGADPGRHGRGDR